MAKLVTIFWPRLMAGDMNGEGGKRGEGGHSCYLCPIISAQFSRQTDIIPAVDHTLKDRQDPGGSH
jgi:hypothetical protein